MNSMYQFEAEIGERKHYERIGQSSISPVVLERGRSATSSERNLEFLNYWVVGLRWSTFSRTLARSCG